MGGLLSEPVTVKHSEAGGPGYGGSGSKPLLQAWAASAMQGWRKSMEDAHIAEPEFGEGLAFFGVFDGHGGSEVAQFCREKLAAELKRQLAAHRTEAQAGAGGWGSALVRAFLELDAVLGRGEAAQELARHRSMGGTSPGGGREEAARLLQAVLMQRRLSGAPTQMKPQELLQDMLAAKMLQQKLRGLRPKAGPDGLDLGISEPDMACGGADNRAEHVGCTAVCVLLSEDAFVCANAGDSRAILCRGGKALDLSRDHKPSVDSERKRIQAAGGTITTQRVEGGRLLQRVNGLSLSRSIGDHAQKQRFDLRPEEQAVTALPELLRGERTSEDEFLVLACDGIWDVLSSQQVADFVRKRLRKGFSPVEVAEQLMERCLSPSPKETNGLGTDNMTCLIVTLNALPEKASRKFSLPSILQQFVPSWSHQSSAAQQPRQSQRIAL